MNIFTRQALHLLSCADASERGFTKALQAYEAASQAHKRYSCGSRHYTFPQEGEIQQVNRSLWNERIQAIEKLLARSERTKADDSPWFLRRCLSDHKRMFTVLCHLEAQHEYMSTKELNNDRIDHILNKIEKERIRREPKKTAEEFYTILTVQDKNQNSGYS